MQRPHQGLGGLGTLQDIGDPPLGVEDEGGREAAQSVGATGDSVRVDQVRERQVVLVDVGASAGLARVASRLHVPGPAPPSCKERTSLPRS
jgi:hypothetical protein